MKQTTKLDSLINKVIAEEFMKEQDGEEKEFVTPDGTARTSTPSQKKMISKMKPGAVIKYRRPGQTTTSTTLEGKEEGMEEQVPQATDIAGKIAEMIDNLSKISEASADLKIQKIAGKAASQLEAAKSTLESLTAHEVMLNEKEHEKYVKNASKKRKSIEKHLSKSVKMPEIVEKLMKRMPDEKIAEMLKKSNGELDEKKLANAMMKVALRESYIK